MKTEQDVQARIKNFTPLMDELVQKFGVITAAIWGRVWRYAQQENRICSASHETIAKELNISIRTAIRHLKILAKNGYLTDTTPTRRNAPHVYLITDKAKIMITFEGVTQSHTGMTESHTRYDTESQQGVTESHMKKELKKQIKKENIKIEIPENLNTPEFIASWQAWNVYRAEIKKKITASTAKIQLKKLSEYDPAIAIAMIAQSIERGWTGLFDVKTDGKHAVLESINFDNGGA